MKNNFELSLIQNPSGSFEFVGSVPLELGFIYPNGLTPNEDDVINDLLLPAKWRKIKNRTFKTKEDAQKALDIYNQKFTNN